MKSTEGAGTSSTMAIGALAGRFGLAPHVLRHWEAEGLLTPDRDPGGRRRYGPGDTVRIAVILQAKEAGLGLPDIRTMFRATGPAIRREVLEDRRVALRQTIASAEAQLELIEGALACDHEDITTCPHFRRLIAERVRTPATRHSHMPTAD